MIAKLLTALLFGMTIGAYLIVSPSHQVSLTASQPSSQPEAVATAIAIASPPTSAPPPAAKSAEKKETPISEPTEAPIPPAPTAIPTATPEPMVPTVNAGECPITDRTFVTHDTFNPNNGQSTGPGEFPWCSDADNAGPTCVAYYNLPNYPAGAIGSWGFDEVESDGSCPHPWQIVQQIVRSHA